MWLITLSGKSKATRKEYVVIGVIKSQSTWNSKLSSLAQDALNADRPIIEVIKYKNTHILIVSGKTAKIAQKALFCLMSIIDKKYKIKHRKSHHGWEII